MHRRTFLRQASLGLAATTAVGMTPARAEKAEFRWKMVTAWPKNFPGLGTGANALAELIGQLSGGRLQVKVYGAGELIPAFEVFDAVAKGTAELGHAGPYYWKGKTEASQFFSSMPFGLTAQEVNAWLYYGGGLELWREAYAPFGLLPAPAGNTGVQMAGWFNREIKSVADLSGLKMRIPGLGGEVLRRAGGTPVNIPGGELFTALQSGALDATEWVGPYNDLAFGLYKAAKYYYYPGWHEPGSILECLINKKAFETLPADLQTIVLTACKAVNLDMISEYTARNQQALDTLINKHQVKVLPLPDEVLQKLKTLSDEVIAELAAKDPLSKKVHESISAFKKQVMPWHAMSEQAFFRARQL